MKSGFVVLMLLSQPSFAQDGTCTKEAAICPDGSIAPRNEKTCEWLPCPASTAKRKTNKACTQEAKLCPDGSIAPRDANTCEWQACPIHDPIVKGDSAVELYKVLAYSEKRCAGTCRISISEVNCTWSYPENKTVIIPDDLAGAKCSYKNSKGVTKNLSGVIAGRMVDVLTNDALVGETCKSEGARPNWKNCSRTATEDLYCERAIGNNEHKVICNPTEHIFPVEKSANPVKTQSPSGSTQ